MRINNAEDGADAGTSVHVFHAQNTLVEVLLAAKTIEKLGYVPELRFVDDHDEPAAIELYVRDIPSLIAKLRGSLTAAPPLTTAGPAPAVEIVEMDVAS